jgi:hypothetical protein
LSVFTPERLCRLKQGIIYRYVLNQAQAVNVFDNFIINNLYTNEFGCDEDTIDAFITLLFTDGAFTDPTNEYERNYIDSLQGDNAIIKGESWFNTNTIDNLLRTGKGSVALFLLNYYEMIDVDSMFNNVNKTKGTYSLFKKISINPSYKTLGVEGTIICEAILLNYLRNIPASENPTHNIDSRDVSKFIIWSEDEYKYIEKQIVMPPGDMDGVDG